MVWSRISICRRRVVKVLGNGSLVVPAPAAAEVHVPVLGGHTT